MMNKSISLPEWFKTILLNPDATQVWSTISDYVLNKAKQSYNPLELHSSLLPLDNTLADAAWGLWERFPEAAPRTAEFLQDWWLKNANGVHGRAVLIVDALSLRELPLLLDLFEQKQVVPRNIKATATEVPTDTDSFASALGLTGRAKLNESVLPPGFLLPSHDLFTAVLNQSFADCIPLLSPSHDIVVWHDWLDVHLHAHSHNANAFERIVHDGLTGRGAENFWTLIESLRQGRRLLITSDHGYANTQRFAHDELDGRTREYLQKNLHASRVYRVTDEATENFMPPLLLTRNKSHVALGQRTWKVQGRYPEVCHGGLSLLEAFVPFIELAER